MRLSGLWLALGLLLAGSSAHDPADDFSEFDTGDIGNGNVPVENEEPAPVNKAVPEAVFEEDEFATMTEDEFDGNVANGLKPEMDPPVEKKINPLTFADIPAHFRSNWSSYQVEALMLCIIVIYSLNFLLGKSKNYALASEWNSQTQEVLREQFALVGDDGTSQDPVGGNMIKDTEYAYSIWSSGRVGVQGMLSSLKLLKRQDLMGVFVNVVSPKKDRVVHKVDLDPGELDSFVIAFGSRKSLVKVVKEYYDLSNFTTEKKPQIPVPAQLAVFAEISETIPGVIDLSVQQFLKRHENAIDYFHFSDQYCGPKNQEDSQSRLPDTAPTLIFSYNLVEGGDQEEFHRILLQFTFHTIDRLRRYRLSREGKMKAEKKRKSVEEAFLKNTHLQRQEAAQARREERSRERKQRLLEEEDPEKQKKLQKLEDKKNNKLKLPKMKQLRVK